jgi:hypothetical protein
VGEEERSLFSLAGSVARRLSDGQIALMTSVGLVGATLVPLYAAAFWKAGVACLLLAAYGGWGIFGRSVIRPRWLRQVARGFTATVAVLAAFLLLFLSMEFVLVNIRQ